MRSQRLRSRTAHSALRPGSGVSIGHVAIRIVPPGARTPSRRAALLGSVCIGALAMLGPGTAHAVDGTWTGATTSEWTTGTNWNSAPPNTVPDNLATFANNGAPTSVTISNSTSINTIAFDAAAPAYSFTVQNGATFTINDSSSSKSNFSVSNGATLAIGNGGSVEIGSLTGAGALQLGASDPNTILFISGSTSTTFSGVISGPGSIELDDAATLRLTGASNGGNIGTIGGDLDLCLCSTGGLTIDGGRLTVNGLFMGVAVESGFLSVINGGTLTIGSSSSPSGTSDLLVADRMLISGAGSTVTVAGVTGIGIFGPNALLTISNGGVLNSQSGAEIDAFLPGGTPAVTVTGPGAAWNVGNVLFVGNGPSSSGGPGTLTISNGGVVSVNGAINVGDGATFTSTVTVTGAGSVLNALTSLAIGDPCDCLVGTLTVANGGVVNSPGFTGIGKGSTLNLGTGGLAGAIVSPAIDNHGQIIANFTDTLTLAANISGPGELRKAGVGTLILTGNSTYRGSTTVDGGTLSVNGSIASSALTVNAGGTIGGNGIIGNTTINGGGTLAPGNSIGTLTVQGNLVMTSAAAYIVEVSPTNADRTNVTGTATLGGTVQAVFAPGAYISRTYTILSATSGSTGTFSSLTTSGLPAGFKAGLSYTATDTILNLFANLSVLPNDIGAGGLSINQRNVATALDNFFNSGGALPPGFLPIFGLTGSNLGNALSQLSGEAATGGQQSAFQMGNQFLGMMLDPFVDGRNGAAGVGGPATAFAPEREAVPEEIALAYAAVLKAPAVPVPSFEQRWSAWGGGYGGSNRTSGDPAVVGSHDLSARTAGFAGGLDYRVTPNTVVGIALAGGGTNWSLANGLGGGKSDAFQAGVYGVTRSGPAYLAAALAFTNHWMSTDRFAFAGDHLTASFNAQSLGARVESGYRFATIFGGIAPYAAIQAQSFRTPTYRETDVNGGGFALGYNGRTATDTRSELGARFDRLLALNPNAALALRARLAWAHDWVSNSTLAAVFQALPGASFIVNGAAPAMNSALASAGTELRLANGVTLIGKFDGEFAAHSSTYAGTGTVRYTW